MDSTLLKPNIFNANPNSSQANKKWNHWQQKFVNYVKSFPKDTPLSEDDKFQLLIAHVDESVFVLIDKCGSYEIAMKTLESVYGRAHSVIFARHLLMSCKQEADQSLDDYLHHLKQLSKDCFYCDVKAGVCRDEAIRDAFIAGISSQTIRQRLLENLKEDQITLEDIFARARTLDSAQRKAGILGKQNADGNIERNNKDKVDRKRLSKTALPDHQKLHPSKSLQDFMEKRDINRDLLQTFRVTFVYAKEVVYQCDIDFSQGHRFVHDTPEKSQFPDIWPTYPFPNYFGTDPAVAEALKNIADGFTLKSVGGYELHGMRFGKGHIYYTSCNTNDDFVKMDINKETSLFSFVSYTEQAVAKRTGGRLNTPSCQVILAYGMKGPTMPVCVVIEPVIADELKRCFLPELPSGDSASLLYSVKGSMDQLHETLEKFDNQHQAANDDNLYPKRRKLSEAT